MSATSDNNKRIAKNFPSKRVQSQACLSYAERKESQRRIVFNTLMLYFRMILLMLISLYTSRVNLNALGVEDYGIYNVVGGVVAMFSLLSNSLSSAISRFITFELGRGDHQRLKDIFSASVTIQLVLSLIIIVLIETIGLWFLNTHLVIPAERLRAANWVFQFSVLTFVINLISVPYNASIIAHEKMSAFAYISILEAAGKLAVALLIVHSPIDRLIFFAAMLCGIAVLLRIVYGWYCTRHFSECHYHPRWDGQLLRQMFSFAGWNFMGSSAYLFNTQGVNMMINIFFGVAVNAARGVAVQVNAALMQFVHSFTTAVNPQITKYFAVGDYESMHRLMFRSAKFSSFLFFLFAIPLTLEADAVLLLWLKHPPTYAVLFVQFTIWCTFVDSILANSLVTAMLATGKIKRYQITVSIVGIGVFVFSWIAYALGMPPQSTYVVWLIIYAIILYIRLHMLKTMCYLSPTGYVRQVLVPVLSVLVISSILPILIVCLCKPGIVRLICVCLVSITIAALSAYSIGMTSKEKEFVKDKTIRKFIEKRL